MPSSMPAASCGASCRPISTPVHSAAKPGSNGVKLMAIAKPSGKARLCTVKCATSEAAVEHGPAHQGKQGNRQYDLAGRTCMNGSATVLGNACCWRREYLGRKWWARQGL